MGKSLRQRRLLQRRRPEGAAVIIARKSVETKYTDLMKTARANVSPTAFNIRPVKTHFTKRGELIIELKGGDADDVIRFTNRLREVLGTLADVRQPQRLTTLLILDVEEWTSDEEVQAAIGEAGKIAGRKPMGRGCQMVTVRVPIDVALPILERGRIPLGWSSCRVRSLEKETQASPRCFKCQRRGHLSAECSGDALTGCYRCGEEGHRLKDCRKEPRCPVCSRAGKDPKHLLGSRGCLGAATPSSSRGGGGGARR